MYTNFSRTQRGGSGIISGKAGLRDGTEAKWEISVNYADALVLSEQDIETLVITGMIAWRDDVSSKLLVKIRAAALQSSHSRGKLVRNLQKQGLLP